MNALLWITHVWGPEIEAAFEDLLAVEGPGAPHVWLLLDARTPGARTIAARYPRVRVFDEQTLFALPYPRLEGRGLMHHPHFPVLDFFLAHGGYDRYWVVEYDVRYTGPWRALLDRFEACEHDLITSHIRRFPDEPRWFWWDSLHHPTEAIARERRLRSFNVIYRLSRAALAFLHEAQASGWRGYSEVSLPTLLWHNGFTLLDFGGDGPFAPSDLANSVYSSHSSQSGTLTVFGSIRYRPARARAGPIPNRLYHPVKPRAMVEGPAARLRILLRWAFEAGRDLVTRRESGPEQPAARTAAGRRDERVPAGSHRQLARLPRDRSGS